MSDEQTADDRLDGAGIDAAGGARFVRASHLTGRPVVTLEGDHDVEVKDVVFDKAVGSFTGFTLRKPGLLGGPQHHVLPIAGVTAIGPDAVMVPSPSAFAEPSVLADAGDDVIGDQVVTDDGTALGTVVDVIASVHGGEADIVGFEVAASESVDPDGAHVFIPLPATTAMSGEAIVVPAAARDFVTRHEVDFAGSVDAFRRRLEQP